MTLKSDLSAFAEDLYQLTREALLNQFAAEMGRHFYAAAFHHVELDQAVPPLFALQCIENLPDPSNTEKPVERWDCAVWPQVSAVEDWFAQTLGAMQQGQSPSQWQSSVKQLEKSLISVCKRLTAELKKCCTNLTADFAVLILDDDFRLTPKCVSKTQLMRLFPHLDEPRRRAEEIARLPLERQIEIHLAALDSDDSIVSRDADDALRKIGPVAAPCVARSMGAAKNSWRYAMLLEVYCVRSPEVIAALKHLALDRSNRTVWPASALATLGEHEWLIHNPALSDDTVVSAVLHTVSSWRNYQLDPLPFCYQPLELLISARASAKEGLLAEMLRSSFSDLHAKDMPIALAGTEHPFAGIRRHAACVLYRTRKSKPYGARIVAALLPLLDDSHPRVRYNALVTLGSWTSLLPDDPTPFAHLAHHHPDEATRHIATNILAAITSKLAKV